MRKIYKRKAASVKADTGGCPKVPNMIVTHSTLLKRSYGIQASGTFSRRVSAFKANMTFSGLAPANASSARASSIIIASIPPGTAQDGRRLAYQRRT